MFWRSRWWVNWSRVVDARGEGQRGVALDTVSDGDQRDLRRLSAGPTGWRDDVKVTIVRLQNKTYDQKPFG